MRSPVRKSQGGFTLLEVVVALSILAMVLMAIFDLNATAVRSHVYTKRVTVASLLARSKMTDLEQEIYEDGPSVDDEEEDGDFTDEGWPNMKWKARIIAPRTANLTPEQLIGALFNIPMGDGGEGGGIAGLFGDAAKSLGGQDGSSPGGTGNILEMLGPMQGMIQGQFTQLMQQLAQGVREVHLTVSWKEGDTTESIDLVTHVVAFGPGGDRNGAVTPGGTR